MTYTIERSSIDGRVVALRTDTGSFIPIDPANSAFQDFLAWHGPLPTCDSRDWTQDPDGHIREMTADEKATRDADMAAEATAERWASVRQERDNRLTIVDHARNAVDDLTALGSISDTESTDARTSLALLRQQLRDLPQTSADPFQLTWPMPAELLTPYLSNDDLARLTAAY